MWQHMVRILSATFSDQSLTSLAPKRQVACLRSATLTRASTIVPLLKLRFSCRARNFRSNAPWRFKTTVLSPDLPGRSPYEIFVGVVT